MKKILSILLPTLFLPVAALLAVSCVDEEPDRLAGDAWPLVIYADIDGSAAHTRAALTTIDDLWSYVGFEEDGEDFMGFYSSGGNWTVDNGKGNFDNLKLQYKNKQFNDPENGVEFSPSHMEGSKIYMYYPYEPNMNTTGLELRIRVEEEDDYVVDDDNKESKNYLLRCKDYLSSNSITLDGVKDGNQMALYGAFKHAFSELIIMRGKGFDNPPSGKWRITAVLDVGCTHIKVAIDTESGWSCSPQLVYAENNYNLSSEEARRWNAWRGGNYGITNVDTEGKPAWYVIVPTLPGNRNSTVEYIELYDNEGYLQRVSSLKLRGGNTKYVDPGWRYPMEITMEELVPTINPFQVVPWKDDVDLTDERTRGINGLAEFEQWVYYYNAWLIDGPDPDKKNALLKYGDALVDSEGNISWHFYLLSDLDLSKYEPFPGNDGETDGSSTLPTDCIVPELADVLDGKSTTLVNGKFINHTISGLTKTFIETISPGGSLQNLDFVEPDVRNNEDSKSPAGILVNTLKNGEVLNCNILFGTLINPDGPAGMVAGEMFGGKIGNCTLSGFLRAGSTINGIAGMASPDAIIKDNDADAVVRPQP